MKNYKIIKRLSTLFAIAALSINIAFAQCLINNITSTNTCSGLCHGTIEIFASGGSGVYIYSIDSGATFQACNLFTGLCSGTYSIVLDDLNGCQDSLNVIITEWSSLFVSVVSLDVSCNGACDGALSAFAAGGSPPYMYQWSTDPVQTDATAIGLCTGTYTVTVTDINGCQALASGTVSEPTPIIVSTSGTDTISCGACDGAVISFVSGGISPYTYLWDAGDTTDFITGLCAGMYNVVVTDANGCNENATVGVIEIGLTTSATDVVCNGACDGTATVSFTCSNSPCSIIWLDGSGASIGQTDTTATGLCAGDYFVQVTNNTGCISFDEVTINEPPTQLTASITETNTSCVGTCDGSATVTPSGGVSPYTYLWSPSGQTSQTATGLCAGIHTAIVTDSLACSDTMEVIVSSPDTIVFNTSIIYPTCGLCDGQAITCITGGTPPYTYSWTTGSTTFYEDSLCEGTYGLTVTDTNNCIASDNVTTLQIIISISDTICDNDSILLEGQYQNTPGIYYDTLLSVNGCDSVVATTLTVNLTYDTTATAVICEGDSILLPGGVFADTPGTYYDTLPTVDGCDSVIATTLTVNLNPIVVIIGDPIACDSALLDEGVGIPGDTYLWSTNDTTQTIVVDTTGMYWLIVTDGNGCQGSDSINVIVNPTYFTPLSDTICNGDSLLLGGAYQTTPGTYYDTLPTVSNCDSVIATTLTVNPLPVITVAPLPGIVCNYGDTVMLVSNGAGSYTWSPAIGLNTTTGDTVLAFPSTDTTYTVTGTSASGCIDSTTVSVQLSTAAPVASFTASTTNVCEGNTVTFNNTSTDATGFSWSFPGGTTADTTVQNPVVTYNTASVFDVTLIAFGCLTDSTIIIAGYITVNPIYTTPLLDTICEGDSSLIGGVWQTTQGTYYDTIPTVNGCDSIIATTLTVNPIPTVVIIGDTIACGSAILDEGVGIPGDTYLWSTNDITQTIIVTTTGMYWLIVTDGNGCQGSDSINVIVYPIYDTTITAVTCQGDSIQLPGGAYADTSGIYYDTLSSVDGCDSVITTTLTVNPTYNVSLSDTICAGDSVFIGGAWQTTPGNYYDTGTVNGCDSIVVTTLTVNQNDTITASKSICFGDSIFLGGAYQTNAGIYYDIYSSNNCDSVVITTLSVNLLPTSPTVTINGNQLASSPANGYQWYFYDTLLVGATSQFYTATQTGFYSVMVSDVNGCWSISDPYFVTVTSINEIEFLNNLNIYPNPNTGEFIIEMNVSKVQNIEIKLFNIAGKIIFKETLTQYSGFYHKAINLKGYAKGIYNLQVITDTGVINKKVVLE